MVKRSKAAHKEGRKLTMGDIVLISLTKPTKMELQEKILIELGFEEGDEHPYRIF